MLGKVFPDMESSIMILFLKVPFLFFVRPVNSFWVCEITVGVCNRVNSSREGFESFVGEKLS